MTLEDAKQLLVDRIVALQGIKATQLIADPAIVDVLLAEHDIGKLCDELVAEGRIVEVEYTVPEMEWRAKSFFLPAGATVRVIGA